MFQEQLQRLKSNQAINRAAPTGRPERTVVMEEQNCCSILAGMTRGFGQALDPRTRALLLGLLQRGPQGQDCA